MKPSKAEKQLRILMLIYTVMFAIGCAQFYTGPDKLLTRLNTVGAWFGFDPVPLSGERFWLFLAVSLMATITTCCLIAAINIRENRHFVLPVIVSKLVSSSIGMKQFVAVKPHGFMYLVIFLTDFPLFVLAVWFYLRALSGKGGEKEKVDKPSDESRASGLDTKLVS